MIDRSHDLPITRQAKVLNVSRGSVYYLPRAPSSADLALMRRMDELHLDFPFAGSRMLRDLLVAEGFTVGRLHVSTLMKRMGIEALYRFDDAMRGWGQQVIWDLAAPTLDGMGPKGSRAHSEEEFVETASTIAIDTQQRTQPGTPGPPSAVAT